MSSPASSQATPYDGAYKHIFSHSEMIEPLLRGFIHQDWVDRIDFTGLEKLNSSYVSEELLQRSNDIVWRLPLRRDTAGEEAPRQWIYLYLLLEFQSSPDPHMALRLLTYVCLLYQDLLKGGRVRAGQQLPPVFPLVLYNGTAAWTGPLELKALIDAPGSLQRWAPGFRYELLNETRVAPATLTALRGNLMACLVALEQVSEPEVLIELVATLARLLKSHPSLNRAFTAFIRRVVLPKKAGGVNLEHIQDLQEMESMLAEQVGEWAEKWKREGLQEGRQEGRIEGERLLLQRQLTRRFGPLPPEALQRLAQADVAQLETWADRVLEATTLDDVLAPPAA